MFVDSTNQGKRPERKRLVVRPSVRISQLLASALLFAGAAWATDYHVGPGQSYTMIGQVPWYALQAGDNVYIHYQSTPYYEKFLISGQGTASNWIRVIGVPGPNGQLPVISGNGATTSTNNHYRWQTPTGSSAIQWDGVIQIAVRADDRPALRHYPPTLKYQDCRYRTPIRTTVSQRRTGPSRSSTASRPAFTPAPPSTF
jgi:hypothetical protein